MRVETRIQFAAAAVLGLSLLGASLLAPAITAQAGRSQLNYTDRAEEGDPPEVALGIAMGAFRGLFVNLLWYRVEQMKREGKFYEAVQLSRTITKLQPRFPHIWSFLAWNMAYNISVASHTADERWRWVKSGIELLRDEGIPRNPNEPLLHKELAWIFFHKIQGFADDANQYYKRQLAREWTIVMGPPPLVDAPTAEERIQYRLGVLQQIINAPDTLEQVIKKEPKVAELVDRIKSETDLKLGYELMRLFTLRVMLDFTSENQAGEVELIDANRNPALEKLIRDEQYEFAWRALIPHLRKRLLIDNYHMEPERMARYTRTYGPLDWRHACSHSIYWASRGVEEGDRRINVEDFDFTNTDRSIMGAIQDLYRWGTINYDIINDSYVQMLNLDYIDVYDNVFNNIINPRANRRGSVETRKGVESEDKPFRVMVMGYVNFLKDVVRVYYRMGEREKAAQYFEKLRTWKGINYTVDESILGLPLDEFIKEDFNERIDSPQFASSEINASLHDAFLRGLLRGDREVFQRQRTYAYKVHQHFNKRQNMVTTADAKANRMNFIPPVYIDAEASVLYEIILQLTAGQQRELPIEASKIYQRSPLRTAQAVYDQLNNALSSRIPNFDYWFPEPPGMKEYRELRESLKGNSDEANKKLMNTQTR
jgi:hypothetical protein